MKKRIAIQDANILIDLVETGLFEYCLALQYQFITTNIIFDELYEEQQAAISSHISSGKFIVIEISEIELVEIQLMSMEDNRLSVQDWSAVYFAEKKKTILISGDKRLRNLAKTKKITVCGIFWLLDQLIETKTITEKQACLYLRDLMIKNKRLPTEECEKRIDKWCNG